VDLAETDENGNETKMEKVVKTAKFVVQVDDLISSKTSVVHLSQGRPSYIILLVHWANVVCHHAIWAFLVSVFSPAS
jgi:hypothetical protein